MPQFVKFHGACFSEGDGSASGSILLVSEYMEHGNVEAYLRSKRAAMHHPYAPPADVVCKWALSIVRALKYIHHECQPHLTHGNLRPSNLLLASDLDIKVSSVSMLSPAEHRYKPDELSLETCLYTAPEIMLEQRYKTSADIYSFAFILWFICTGTRPLAHLDNDGSHRPTDHVLEAFKTGKAPRPSLRSVNLGHDVRDLLQSAWDADEGKRPSAEHIEQRLVGIQESFKKSKSCSVQ